MSNLRTILAMQYQFYIILITFELNYCYHNTGSMKRTIWNGLWVEVNFVESSVAWDYKPDFWLYILGSRKHSLTNMQIYS